MGKSFPKKQVCRAFVMVLTCVSFLLCGCTGEEYVQHAKSEAGCDEDFTLDYYIWSDEETYVRKVVEAWNALQGREAVRLYVIPDDEHDDWVENYGESVGADLVGLRGNSHVIKFQQRGFLLGLREYLKASDLDVTAYGNMYNAITIDNEFYALPTRSTCWVLYYNKELFDQAGVPYPEQMTWEEYEELALTMTKDSEDEKIWGGYFPLWIPQFCAIQKGYYLLDDDMEPTRDSLELIKRLYRDSHMPYEEFRLRDNDYCQDFEKGNIAMMVNGEWLANQLLEDEAEGISVPEWGVAPVPVPQGVEAGTTLGMYQFAGITSSCACPEEAFAFLEFLCGKQGAEIYVRDAIIPAYSDEEIREIYEEMLGEESTKVFFEAKRVMEQPMWNDYDALLEKFRSLADLYFRDELSLDEVMKRFENDRRDILQ